jgi:hypothetical protein
LLGEEGVCLLLVFLEELWLLSGGAGWPLPDREGGRRCHDGSNASCVVLN